VSEHLRQEHWLVQKVNLDFEVLLVTLVILAGRELLVCLAVFCLFSVILCYTKYMDKK